MIDPDPIPFGKFTKNKARNEDFGFTAQDLGSMDFPPIKWIVPGYIPEGCSLLAGRPKLGKSWMVLDIALAVARGGYCLGDAECAQGEVLYLALEDNKRRLQSRIRKVSTTLCKDLWPKGLTFATAWPRCDDGGLDRVRTWLKGATSPRLVVVDVLAQFRAHKGRDESVYESDYKAIKGLQELASEFGIAVVIVHHTRKGTSDVDPFEQISGTLGLSGAADAAIVLDRTAEGCTLYGRGRDIEEYEKAVTFDKATCRWTVQGDANEVHRSDERGRILAAIDENEAPMSPSELATVTGMKGGNVRRLLLSMGKAGDVRKVRYGKYARNDPPTHTVGNTGNSVTVERDYE